MSTVDIHSNPKDVVDNPLPLSEKLVLELPGSNEIYPASDRVDPGNDPTMKNERSRYLSFRNWPVTFVSPEDLSVAGFYYTGQADHAQCPFCKLIVGNWEPGDDALEEHRQKSHSCPFLLDKNVGNIQLSEHERHELYSRVRPSLLSTPRSSHGDAQPTPETVEAFEATHSDSDPSSGSPERLFTRTANFPPGGPPSQAKEANVPLYRPSTAEPKPQGARTTVTTTNRPYSAHVNINTSRGQHASPGPASGTGGGQVGYSQTANVTQNIRIGNVNVPHGSRSVNIGNISTFQNIQAGERGREFMYQPHLHQPVCRPRPPNPPPYTPPNIRGQKYYSPAPFPATTVTPTPPVFPAAAEVASSTGPMPIEDQHMMGINFQKPKSQQFATKQSRIRSFENWPNARYQSPESMASAGFYYTHDRDKVKCFFCDGGLSNWMSTDVPWVEHAKWYPNCAYLQQCKGREFITAVKHNEDRKKAESERLQSQSNPTSRQISSAPSSFSSQVLQAQSGRSPISSHGGITGPMGPAGSSHQIASNRLPTDLESYRNRYRHYYPQAYNLHRNLYNELRDDIVRFRLGVSFILHFNNQRDLHEHLPLLQAAGEGEKARDSEVIIEAMEKMEGEGLISIGNYDYLTQVFTQLDAITDSQFRNLNSRVHKALQTLNKLEHNVKDLPHGLTIDMSDLPQLIESPRAKAVELLGFSRAEILRVLEQRIQERGIDFNDVGEMLDKLNALKLPDNLASMQLSQGVDYISPEIINILTSRVELHVNWKILGRALSVSDQELSEVDVSLQNNVAKLRAILQKFRSMRGSRSALYTALDRIQFHHIVEILEAATSAPSSRPSAPAAGTFGGPSVVGGSGGGTQQSHLQEPSTQPGPSSAVVSNSSPSNRRPATDTVARPEGHQGGTEGTLDSDEDISIKFNKLQEERICKICMDRDVNIVFLPCGHLVSCDECAPALSNCPICRTPIHGSVRTFMS